MDFAQGVTLRWSRRASAHLRTRVSLRRRRRDAPCQSVQLLDYETALLGGGTPGQEPHHRDASIQRGLLLGGGEEGVLHEERT